MATFIFMTSRKYFRWFPAVVVMGVIFWFSSQPSNELPNFGLADFVVKKSGHVIEYAILTACYWFGFGFQNDRSWLAWLFAVIYAATDEFHQSFVPGRIPSIWDIVIFDNLGVMFGLWFAKRILKQKRPAHLS